MKIKSIYIDGLHNAVKKTYTFGDIVYLFGHNGAGKSTVLQAIQFALLGYIPGTAKNSREALLRHSPKGSILVKLELDEVTIERKVWAQGGRIDVDPVTYDISSLTKELELPIFNFNDFMGQTANKLKEYFIKNILPTTEGALDWDKILLESVVDCNFEDNDAMLAYGKKVLGTLEGGTLDQIVSANAKFKAEQTFNKSELQRLQHTIDSLIYYDDYVGPTDPGVLTGELLSRNALRDQLLRYESAVATVKTSQEELDRCTELITILGGDAAYNTAIDSIAVLESRESQLTISIAAKRNDLAALRAAIDSMSQIIESHGVCPYTQNTCDSMLVEIENLRNAQASKSAEATDLEGQIENLYLDLETCRNELNSCKSLVNQFTTTRDRIEVLQSTLGSLPEKPDTNKTIIDLNAEIEKITDSLMKLQANINYNETIDNITKLKYTAELKGEALSRWIKKTDTNGLQTTLMEKPFKELAETMTGYLYQMYRNTDLKAHFNISSKANSFSFGLIRGGNYVPYDMLSSGEKCLYNLALMVCIVDNSKAPLKLLLCDDMFDHLDGAAIEHSFEAMKSIVATDPNIQFILAGVKDCAAASDVMIQFD